LKKSGRIPVTPSRNVYVSPKSEASNTKSKNTNKKTPHRQVLLYPEPIRPTTHPPQAPGRSHAPKLSASRTHTLSSTYQTTSRHPFHMRCVKLATPNACGDRNPSAIEAPKPRNMTSLYSVPYSSAGVRSKEARRHRGAFFRTLVG
jgi:hypothetical protein